MRNIVSSSVANISINKVSGVGNYANTINRNSSNVNLNNQNKKTEEYNFNNTIEQTNYESYKIMIEEWTEIFHTTLEQKKRELNKLEGDFRFFLTDQKSILIVNPSNGQWYTPDELKKDTMQLQTYIDNYGEIEGKERFYKWVDEEYAPLFNEYLKEAIGMTYEEYLTEKSTLESSISELSGMYYQLSQEQKVLPYLEISESAEYQNWLSDRENSMPEITMERNVFWGDKIFVNGVETDPRNVDPMLLGYAIDKGYITHNSVHKGMTNVVDASDYYYLTQDQRNMYSYLYETQGKEKAEEYKVAIEDSINQAKALEDVNSIIERCTVDGKLNYDTLMQLTLEGIESGVISFGEGVVNLFNSEGMISVNDYKTMYLLNALTNSKDAYLNEIITDIYNSKGSAYAETFYQNVYNSETGEINLNYAKSYLTESQYKELEDRIISDKSFATQIYAGGYELGSAFGNMLPTIVLAYLTKGASLTVGASAETAGIIGSVVGNTAMGVSSAGNAYNQALIQGNRRGTSYLYGMFSGISETTLGMLLGNIPGLNTNASFSLKGILSEGIEEGLQTYVDAALTSVVLGEPVNLNDCHGEALKGAIYGMILSGITNGVETTYKVAVGSQYANLSFNNLLDFYKLLNTSNMSVQTDKSGNATFVIEGNEVVPQDTIDKIKSIFPDVEIVQKYSDGTISRPLIEINQTEKNNIFLDSNNENSPKIIPVDTSMKNDALNALTDEEFFNLIKLEISEYPRTTIERRVRDYGKVIKILGKGNIVRYFNENFSEQMHPNIRETILTELSMRIARYNEALNYNEIQQIFNEVLQNIIKEQNLGKENFSSTFILKYQEYFLPDNAPLELKNLYYNKLLTYEDIVKYYNYFGSTNISCGFVEAVVRGKFDNTSFIKLLDACKGDINKFKELSYVKYFERSDQQYKISSYEDFLIELDNYYKENRIIFKELNILKELNFNNEYLNDIENNIKKSGISEKHLYNTDVRIFSNKIVERFGFDVIRSIVEYRNSGAMELFIKYASNEQYSYKLITWFNYLNKNNLLDSKMINYAILSFESCSQLVDKLLENEYILDENQKENLRSILINKNEFGVSNISELADYIEYKKNQLSSKLNSEDMTDVKNAILQVLFGLSWDETKGFSGLIDKYNLNNKEFFETYVSSSTYITPEIKEAIQLIIEICNSKDLVALKRKFENIIKLGNMRVNKELLYESLTAVYSEIWNQQLFRYDENINGIKISFVDGVDSTICTMNVNGRHISSEDKIQVIELNGEKFKLIIHGISPKIGADTSLGNISKQLIDNPSLWNKLEGSTTISTSLISEKHLAVFGGSDQQVVYYGFNNLPVDVLKGTGQSDSGTMHGGGQLDAISGATKIMTPDILLELSAVDRYNEVVLMRKSNIDTEKNEGRVQPNCIICFNGYISDASKLAAQYFDVPIYMINENNYNVINQNN